MDGVVLLAELHTEDQGTLTNNCFSIVLSQTLQNLLIYDKNDRFSVYKLAKQFDNEDKGATCICSKISDGIVESVLFSEDEKYFALLLTQPKKVVLYSIYGLEVKKESEFFIESEPSINITTRRTDNEIDPYRNLEKPGKLLQVQGDRICLYDNSCLSIYSVTQTSKWVQDFYVKIGSSNHAIDFNKNCLYCLQDRNIIYIYNFQKAKHDGVFDLSLILPQGLRFKNISVNRNGTQVALLEMSNLIYVVDVFADTSVFQAYDQDDYRVEVNREALQKTFPSATSDSATSSSWFTYLDRLANKKKTDIRSQAVQVYNAFICIRDIPQDFTVKSMHFCFNSLAVWASSSDVAAGKNMYRMYNLSTGLIESEVVLPIDTHVARFDSSKLSLDLFFQPFNLFMPLKVISKLNSIQGERENELDEMNKLFGKAVLPMKLMKEGLSQAQLDVVKLALKLHTQGFKSKLSEVSISLEELLAIIKELFDPVVALVSANDDGSIEGKVWRSKLQILVLTHANTLLAMISSPLHQIELQTEILNYVIALRNGGFDKEVAAPVIPEWVSWMSLSDEEVVINSITSIPLVKNFLSLHRGWSKEELAGERFIKCVQTVIEKMLLKRELNQASMLFKQLNMDADKELRIYCLKCRDLKVRDYLMSSVKEGEVVEAWQFLKRIEGILLPKSQFQATAESPLNISTVLLLSDREKSEIVTDLYFTTLEPCLENELNKHCCWNHLLENNCTDGILSWLGSETSSKFPWPLELFSQWEVDQTMVDKVLEADCTDLTKYTICNKLASSGYLTTEDLVSPKKLLLRMAYAGLFPDLNATLNRPYSNFNYCKFSNLILQHALTEDLVLLAVKFGLNEHCSDNTSPDWAKLFKLHTHKADDGDVWEHSKVIKRVEETTEYLASHESISSTLYLKQHPLVAIVTDMLKGEDVCQKYSHVSPLLAAAAPLTPSTLASSTGDVTLYSLLANAVPFHTDNIFQHQISGQKNSPLPDFSNQNLSLRYGSHYSVGYREFLQQGRPASAICSVMKNGRFSIRTRTLAKTAHALALSHCSEPLVSCACVVFTEMLGHDTRLLRMHLTMANVLRNYIAPKKLDEHMKTLAESREASPVLADLEKSLEQKWAEEMGGKTGSVALIDCLKQFQLAVRLAVHHDLPAPDSLLQLSLESGNWLMFVLAAQIFQYPVTKVLEVISTSENKEISKHLYYALCSNLSNDKESASVEDLEPHPDLFGCLAQLGEDSEALFTAARRLNSPILALLAASIQGDEEERGLCEWLLASLPPVEAALFPAPDTWTPDSLTQLIETVVQHGFLRTLAKGFATFKPMHPFCALTSFLVDCVHECKFDESALNLKLFMAAYFNLTNENKISAPFMMRKSWISLTAYRMVFSALASCFSSEYLKRRFLKTLCEATFSDIHPDGQCLPMMLRLSQCLADTSLQLDWKRLFLHKDFSQLSELLLMLSDLHYFDTAFKFAGIANLPVDLVLVTQWSLSADSSERTEHGFWKRCESAFQQGDIDPEAAVSFYRKQASVSKDIQEIYILLRFALNWMLKTSANWDAISVLQTELFMTCLEEKFKPEIITEGVALGALRCLSSELSVVPSPCPPQLKSCQSLRLDDVIHRLLVAGDIKTAFQLQSLFNHTNQDCELLYACMRLAEGQTSVAQLPTRIQECLATENIRRHPISCTSPIPKIRSSNNLLQADEQDILNVLYALQAHQTCSTLLFGNIISGYKISVALKCDYKDVIMDSEPLRRLQLDHDLEIATSLMNLACLTRYECTQYVCSQLVNVLSSDPENGRYTLWGCDVEKEFPSILDLNISALLLGNLIMASDLSLSSNVQSSKYRRVVEMLIIAHSCFTRVCHMEGISSVLNSARSLVNRLLDCAQWMLMVRLLTGIGRYTELNFVFQMLKENDQFEFLLGKGLDKEPRMMAATLEFARHDPELFSLVAHHLSMLGELGALYEAEARAALARLVAGEGEGCAGERRLAPTPHNKRCLDAAMAQFTDAAEHYVQAKKMKCAVWNIQQAELVAVQLNMLTNSTQSTAPCLVNLPESQVLHLIYSVLSCEESHLVASAYNASVDWSAALFNHCVAGGDFGYLTTWLRHHSLTSTTVQDVVTRFQNAEGITKSLEGNMKRFVSFINQLDVKYRVASQLGFKEMLQSMLSSPDMAYLKDTVWQSGFKRHIVQ